jgi:hypothetical protein
VSPPALIKKPDLRKAAEVANETGCSIEIKLGATVYTIHPGKVPSCSRQAGDPPPMADMARKLPQYCYREMPRHGTPRYYFRRGKGARHRLPDFADTAFWPAYELARTNSLQGIRQPKAKQGTLEWLIEFYGQSSAYTGFSAATRRQQDNILANVIRKAGKANYADITRAVIIAGREDRAATPAQARNFLDALRGLFAGRSIAIWRRRIPQPRSRTHAARKAAASKPGRAKMPRPIASAGRLAPLSAPGLKCCSTPACAAGIPFAPAVRI